MDPRYAFLDSFLHLMVFLLGAGIGSFLNVVIYRLPLGMSLDNPRRSFCPGCKKQIPWYLNIPLVSWLMLRGKCANCKTTISVRYFLVELLVALLFYATFRAFGGSWEQIRLWGPHVLGIWILLSLLVSGTFIDLEHFILPHQITGGGAVVGLLCSLWAPELVEQETHMQGLLISFLSAVMGLGLLWSVVELGKIAFGRLRFKFTEATPWSITESKKDEPPVFTVRLEGEEVVHQWEEIFTREKDRLVITCPNLSKESQTGNDLAWTNVTADITMDVVTVKKDAKDREGEKVAWEDVKALRGTAMSIVIPREAMGLGDVFFIAMIGAFTGWKGVVFTIFAGSVLGSVFAMVPRLIGKAEWTAKIPFGPYLAAGAALWVFYGPEWLERYMEWAHLAGR
ncbi:MAG: Prepilin peptidase [Verrucomicrobiaceae bacterium]|nr:Prepilin peptidase [Verrucomicrobiaceae bacterium]